MKRGGFASFSAVIMLAVVASAITAGTAFVTMQWRRSQQYDQEAQLRQFLLAGEVYASQMLLEERLSLDADLPEGGTLRVECVEPLRVRVTAIQGARQMSQVLTYEREGNSVRVRDAELGAVATALR